MRLERHAKRPARSGGDSGALLRPMLLLAVTVFIDLLGFGIVLPNLPRYIEIAVGQDHQQAGLIGGLLGASYSFTQFLCAPLWGRWSDRVGRRPVILLSLIGVAASFTLFGLAGERLWMLFAGRLLAGVLSSASIGVAFAYVADVTTPQNRARGMGVLGACFGLGFVLGPAFGGVLGQYGVALPAFVAAGMALANFAFALRYLPESLKPEQRAEHRARRDNAAVLLGKALTGPSRVLYLLSFLTILAFSALEQIFSFYLLAVPALGVTPERQPLVTGGLLAVAGVLGAVVQGGLIGRLVERFGEAGVIRGGIAAMVLGFVLFPLAPSVVRLAIGPLALLSVGRALAGPALNSLLSRKSTLGQGVTLSAQQSVEALGRAVGPVVAGALFNRSVSAPFYVSAAILSVALVATLVRAADLLPPVEAAEIVGVDDAVVAA